MTVSKDLFLAILAMDAYNRGYGAGLSDSGQNDPDGLGETRNVSQVGAATVSFTLAAISEEFAAQAQAAGFYAVAYDVSGVAGFADGTTVISYRDVFNNADITEVGAIIHGWLAAITPGDAGPPARGLAA